MTALHGGISIRYPSRDAAARQLLKPRLDSGWDGRLEGRGLTAPPQVIYPLHMKRTNLVLDEELLKEATRLSGEKTYSHAVNRALKDFVQRAKARRILELAGSGLWEGNLSDMRRDARGRR